jgi:hypothetical protein
MKILIAYISANIGATNKLPSTDALHFGQSRGFGPHQDVIDIFSMTQLPLQVKRTVESRTASKPFTLLIKK